MVKINDTTTFPNTVPVLTDHIPGTDVSDIANDANGETVTFLLSALRDLIEDNLVTPALGTPASGIATNLTGLPISTGVSGLAANVATFLGTPSSANLLAALTTKTGTGSSVFSISPTFTGTPVLPSTFTIGANNFVRSGAHALTLTTSGATNVTLPTSGTLAKLGANTFTGTQNFGGQQVEGMKNKVVTSVTGALTAASHSGNILKTSGNVTVPTTTGFNAIIIAGGAHTVTFNATTSAAMATGDIMTVAVESATIIHAVLTASADKVSFT